MNKNTPESKIMADFLNNIRAEQDKQAKAIDDLIKLWDSQQVFNEELHEKINELEKQKTIFTKYWSEFNPAIRPV